MLRIIPMLLLERHGLVKTRRFRSPVYVGDPRNVVRIFNEKEVDELILLDRRASPDSAAIDFDFIQEIVSEAFMPVCYGGGVHTVDQARRLLRLGVEKIAVNTAALHDLAFVERLSAEFGAQCVVGALDARSRFGRSSVWSHTGVRIPERDPLEWARMLVRAGAGEILLQSVDQDGTLAGPDLTLLRPFLHALGKPLIVGGGLGTIAHMEAAVRACAPSALAVGARFVFYGPHRAVLVTYLEPRELARLSSLGEDPHFEQQRKPIP